MRPDPRKPPLPSLEELSGKIEGARKTPADDAAPTSQGLGMAMRIGVEFTSGVAVGAFVGLMLDKWLHTSPLFFLLCFCFGAAGGALTVYRTATRARR